MRDKLWNKFGAVAATAALSLVAACGGGQDPAAQSGPAEITFWSWTKGSAEVVDAFNKAQSDVRVKFEQIPAGAAGGYTKMSNAVKAGNAPDVMNIEYPVLPDFVSQGSLADLTKAVEGVKGEFPEQIRGLTELGGKTWAVPLDASPMVFYYRKDFFEANKIALPTTWDEYRAAAAAVKQAAPASRIGTFFPDDPGHFASFAWQAGGRWFGTSGDRWEVSIDDGPTKKVADYWAGLVRDDLVRVQGAFSQEWNADLKSSGTVGYLGASWGAGSALRNSLPEQAGKWAVAPLPHWGEPAGGMYGGSTFAVGKDSKQVDAAVKFITWMTTDEKAVTTRIGVAKSTMYPAAADLGPAAAKSSDPAFFGGQDAYAEFTAAAGQVKPGWTWGPSMFQTNSALKDSFGTVTSGGSLADALTQAQKSTVEELRKRGLNVGP
ncbi:multiple sugar transport system substrate-binding protein [Saccharothrix ecbatanensis]|uniref:Multiple sugar transport system substrate-binding protein n=1 Tax=Saccharothrix ecbatanensis TaxID=1105145 RepID=A0A7W9HJ74_9PSEU|nr:sugar ABC transporter substrate-binding protein [Saccharothrix ecbatanensis]MBB5803120.1 multiple sugar transport system substrate-binding protein [Saccharothrix ecbatanensis]